MRMLITIIFFVFPSLLIDCSSSPRAMQTVLQRSQQIISALALYADGRFVLEGEGIDVDSAIGDPSVSNGQIKDPYGTLRGCSLFLVRTVQAHHPKHALGI